MIRFLSIAVITLICIVVCAAGGAEHLRTDAMYWDVITSEHFTIVHPQGLLAKAREAAFFLEEGYNRISKELETEVKKTILVILYRSQNTFEQNNIYGGSVPESLAAFAETFRDRIVMPVYPSSYRFKYILQHELTHIFEYAALFPRRIPSFYIIRFPFYPQWFMEGLSEYESDFDYAYRTMIIRDKALDNKLQPMYKLFGFSHLNPHEVVPAYKQGGEFIRYLSRIKPGAPRILLKTLSDHMPWKISSIIEKAFSAEYKELDIQFRKHLKKQAKKETEGRGEPDSSYRLCGSHETYYHVFDTDAVWSPDGSRIAFISDVKEKTALYIADKNGTRIKAVVPLRLNFTIESIHRGKGRSVAWAPKGDILYFIGEWANRDYIYRYDLALKKLKRMDVKCEAVRDLSPADENRIIFSGVRSGISDIYLYDMSSEEVKQVTNDVYDDSSPVWNVKNKSIIYSSERKGQRDLILINMKADKVASAQSNITNSPANEINPSWNKAGNKILFVSDAQGFYDMYIMDFSGAREIFKQTGFKGGAFQPVFSPDEKEILFSYYRHGRYTLYRMPVRPDKGEKRTLDPVEAVHKNLRRYKEGVDGTDTAGEYKTDFAWEGLLPFGVFNWGQVGDTFGNHTFSGYLYPGFTEDETFIEGSLVYWNTATRFDIGVGIAKDFWQDIESDERNEDFRIFLQARYPFDAYRSITAGVISGQRQEYENSVLIEDKSRLGGFMQITHDNRLYRGLSFVRGQMLTVGGEFFPGDSDAQDTERYGYVFGSFEQAFTFSQDHTVYVNLSGGLTKGRDRPELDLAYVVRGYDSDEFEGYGRVGATIEYRFPLHRDGSYSILGHYLLLKDIRGFAFADIGAVSLQDPEDFLDDAMAFDLDSRKSIGAGIRMDFYGMQKAPFALKIGVARVLDKDAEETSLFFNLNIQF